MALAASGKSPTGKPSGGKVAPVATASNLAASAKSVQEADRKAKPVSTVKTNKPGAKPGAKNSVKPKAAPKTAREKAKEVKTTKDKKHAADLKRAALNANRRKSAPIVQPAAVTEQG